MEKTLSERRLTFLNETVEYYSVDPVNRRSVVGERCYYRHPDDPNRRCAVGRHIPDDRYDPDIDKRNLNITSSIVHACLPQEIVDLGEDFLSFVQNIHDVDDNWSDSGLTPVGLDKVEFIKEKYIIGIR